jgi:hypothetical protein
MIHRLAGECLVCGFPLDGLLGRLSRIFGIRRSARNPNVCSRCNVHVEEGRLARPLRLGADRIHQVVDGPGGRGIAADIEVTGYEPGRRYAFQVIAGPARPTGEFRFAPSGTGTELSFSLRAELGGLKKLLMSGPVQSSMDGEMRALDTAKSAARGQLTGVASLTRGVGRADCRARSTRLHSERWTSTSSGRSRHRRSGRRWTVSSDRRTAAGTAAPATPGPTATSPRAATTRAPGATS